MNKPSTGILVLGLVTVSLLAPTVRGLAALPASGAPSGAVMAPAPIAPAATNVSPQLAALQSQVNALQAQVAALTSAIQVTQQGLVLRGPSIQIVSQADLRVTVGGELDLKAGANALIQSSGIMGIRGALVQFNGGNKQVATVGSLVAPTNPNSPAPTQVLNGTPTLLTN